jgi:hypothetical protein
MIHTRRIRLLREIRDGHEGLTGGGSAAEQEAAMAKLLEWRRLAERLDITLQTSYTVTQRGAAELRFAMAALTPSGRRVLEDSERQLTSCADPVNHSVLGKRSLRYPRT